MSLHMSNATLLEITCRGHYSFSLMLVMFFVFCFSVKDKIGVSLKNKSTESGLLNYERHPSIGHNKCQIVNSVKTWILQ